MRKHFKLEKARKLICKKPLKRWIHADGSKLSMKDSIKIIGQLGQIASRYNIDPIKNVSLNSKKLVGNLSRM